MQRYQDLFYRSYDGLTLYARDYHSTDSTGVATIVCIPGLTRNSADFDELCDALAGSFRVLAVDLRGRGRSEYDVNPSNYNPVVYAQDIQSLLQSEEIATARFIGTSLGGIVSMTLAAMRPEMVEAVVLNDIGPELGQAGIARIQQYVKRGGLVKNWDEAVEVTRSVHHEALPGLSDIEWERFARGLYQENEIGIPVLSYDKHIADAFDTVETDATPSDLWPLYQSLGGLPILVFRGESSDILSAETVGKMLDINPNARAFEVSGRGHAPFLNELGVLSVIKNFLSDV